MPLPCHYLNEFFHKFSRKFALSQCHSLPLPQQALPQILEKICSRSDLSAGLLSRCATSLPLPKQTLSQILKRNRSCSELSPWFCLSVRVYAMSGPDPADVNVSFFEDYCWNFDDVDLFRDQQYCSPVLEENSTMLQGKGTTVLESDDCAALGTTPDLETESDPDHVDRVEMQGWVNGEDEQPKTMRKKRKRQLAGYDQEVQVSASQLRPERQRGKNWKKTEEDILVELRGKGMEWKPISESLKRSGFIRHWKHCSDKWYALRKHYIEIQKWMVQNPRVHYWDLPAGERIRTVPSYFSRRWYHIFDVADRKPQGKIKVVSPNQRREHDSIVMQRSATAPSPRHFGPAIGGLPLNSSPTSQEGSQQYAGDRSCSGDGDFLSNPDAIDPSHSDIRTLVTEIRDLCHALRLKFETEENERMRHFEVQEKMLQLILDRFNYKRQRDEEKRKQDMLLDALLM